MFFRRILSGVPDVPAERDSWTLLTPVEALPGVTEARAEALRQLDIRCLAHLIAHLPSRHEEEEAETTIDAATAGRLVTVRGEVTDTRVAPYRRPKFEAVLADHTGTIDVVWFNMVFLRDRIRPGMRLRVQGKASRKAGGLLLTNPRWEVIPDSAEEPESREARIRPIYPAAEDLPSWVIERLVAGVLDRALPLIEEHLDDSFRRERALPPLADAYRMMHRPATRGEVDEARRRLVYDELLMLQLGVHMKREHVRRHFHAPPLKWNEAIDRHIRARLPFELTPGQEHVVAELAEDLQRASPANRLVQGDVGSGKTVVALYAMLMAAASRHQAALMAPTTLLAEQHARSIGRLLSGASVRIGLLTGEVVGIERERMLRAIAGGAIDLVVGTHALLTESVEFRSLAVAVIDEQHRFGVHQRARLREQSSDARSAPHTIVMTATPIPRTLALTVFGDLDVSVLQGLPPGRSPIRTRVMTPDRTDEVYAFVRARVEKGEQAYVVAPAIGDEGSPGMFESAASGAEAKAATPDVSTLVRALESGPLAGKRVHGLHGRVPPDERDRIMDRFRRGEIDVLVATTIIEVGVDVPNASVMVIEQADRFGLAQLHQLRGRVGRGSHRSVCILVPSPSPTAGAEARLAAMLSTCDGFKIAEKDLELRGPGEFIGTRQAGAAPFRLAEFPRDTDLLLMARSDAGAWIRRSPLLSLPEERLLRSRLMKAHGESLGLVDVA